MSPPIKILLAEDDDGHAELLEMNLRRTGIENELIRAHDGQEALDILKVESANGTRLILVMDLKMPRVDGLTLLKTIKQQSEYRLLPVIVLTTTSQSEEMRQCYELGCNAYITKSVDYDQFTETIRRLGYFIQTLKFPVISDTSNF